MDITTLQSQITNQEAVVATVTSALSADQAELDKLNSELAIASQVNALEALDEDQIAAFNALLAGNPDNKLNISIVVGIPSAAPVDENAGPAASEGEPIEVEQV